MSPLRLGTCVARDRGTAPRTVARPAPTIGLGVQGADASVLLVARRLEGTGLAHIREETLPEHAGAVVDFAVRVYGQWELARV